MSILRDREDAEDEVQNACWKAYQHIGQFQRDAKFSTWLTRIVVNQCLMRLRQHRRQKMVYVEDVAGEDARVMEFPSDESSPETELGQTEVAQVLRNEISRIPPLLSACVSVAGCAGTSDAGCRRSTRHFFGCGQIAAASGASGTTRTS